MKVHDFKLKKQNGQKIPMVTCYDYFSARTINETQIESVLVGDSVATTIHGYKSTVMATMEMMILHTKAVAKGLKKQFLITDLPFLTHRFSLNKLFMNVKKLVQAGAQAIKIEGGDKDTCEKIAAIVEAGIPVMGHIGLTAQYIHQLGGYFIQGKNERSATKLLTEAKNLQNAGCFALVIECVPATVAQNITASVDIPTIGIGAGPNTDGQILVWHDLLQLQTEFKPHFLKHYADGKTLFINAINNYIDEVNKSLFPELTHSFI